MRILKISVLLCAVVTAKCAPLDSHASEALSLSQRADLTNLDAEPTDDQIRLKLASSPSDTASELDKLASAIAENHTDPQGTEEDEGKSNEVFNEEDLSTDDDISSRFWYWHKKQKKKPSPHQVVHGAEALGHETHGDIPDHTLHAHDYIEEHPGLIKPIVDKIKKPIVDILNKPAEIVAHLLNKPHDVLHDEPSEASIHEPAEISGQLINESHSTIHETPVIDDYLDKPTNNNHNVESSHGSAGLVHNKPNIIDNIKKPIEHFTNEPQLGHDQPGIIDNIKRPIEHLLNKPAQIASQVFNKPHSVITEGSHQYLPNKPNFIDHIKKPIEDLLNKPAQIASQVFNKPHPIIKEGSHQNLPSKPSIIDHIKKPIEAVFHKPVSSIKPEHFDSIIHFPADFEDDQTHKPTIIDTVKPGGIKKPVLDEPYVMFGALAHLYPPTPAVAGSYGGIHKFQPNMGFVFAQPSVHHADHKPSNSGNIKPSIADQSEYWRPIWDIPYSVPQRPQQNSWASKPWSGGLPHSANYGIPSGSYVRGLETDSSEDGYAQSYPYGWGPDYIFI